MCPIRNWILGRYCKWICALVLVSCGTEDSETDRRKFMGSFALLTVSDGLDYDFGIKPVGSATDKEFIVANRGTGHADSISAQFFQTSFTFKGGAYPGLGGTCGTRLEVNTECVIVVRFSPQFPGNFADNVRILYYDNRENQSTSTPNLSGIGF